jgi:thioredoxin-like negative regulator of GroEL
MDEAPDAAGQFNVRSIPTLIVFRHGKEAARFVGAQSAATLAAALEAAA